MAAKCGMCDVGIDDSEEALILCTNCSKWIHKKCSGLNHNQFRHNEATAKKGNCMYRCSKCAPEEVRSPNRATPEVKMEEIKQMFTKIINTNSQQDTKITQLSENVTKLTE